MPLGPRFLRWCIVRPSGPAARELPLFRMAWVTVCVEKGEMFVSSGRDLLRCRLTRRAVGSEVCGVTVVNCLVKAAAMSLSLVSVFVVEGVVKVIGWLGAVWVFLPESVLMSDQKCVVLSLCEHDSTVSIHVFLFVLDMSLEICRSSVCMLGWVGWEDRRASRSSISRLVESGRLGMKFGMCPLGMWCLAADWRIRRNWTSPELQEEGSSRRANLSSVSRVYEVQSAFLRFVKVLWGGSRQLVEKEPPRWIRMGRWSELRVVRGVQVKSSAMWGVAMERSGEEGLPRGGSLVGWSRLSSTKSESKSASWIRVPLAAARPSLV